MLDVGKQWTRTNTGAPGVPQRRLNTATSAALFAAVVERQRISAAPPCHSAKMSKLPASQRGQRSDNDSTGLNRTQPDSTGTQCRSRIFEHGVVCVPEDTRHLVDFGCGNDQGWAEHDDVTDIAYQQAE